jgi:HEAT repeat protein
MRALAVAQPPEAIVAFTSGLRDAEPGVRLLASAGWRKAASIPEDAIPVLVEALHDPETRVRANAAHALGRLDPVPAEAIPLLAECVLDPDTGLRMSAAIALDAAPGSAAAEALHPLLDDPSPRLRLLAAHRLLADEGSIDAAAAVAAALADPVPGVREAAFSLIDRVPTVMEPILTSLRERAASESDPETAGHLAEAVARLEQISASVTAAAEAEPPAEGAAPVAPHADEDAPQPTGIAPVPTQ